MQDARTGAKYLKSIFLDLFEAGFMNVGNIIGYIFLPLVSNTSITRQLAI